VLGTITRRLSRGLITRYDVVIVLPLMVEQMAKSGLSLRRNAVDADDSAHHVRARGSR
jgi:hypothetical protein